MKSSKYNLIYRNDKSMYFYNGLRHAYFRCSLGLGEKLCFYLNRPQEIELNETAHSILYDNGFIIDDSFDELEEIKKLYWESVHSKDYFLIIIPTLNCNFTCPYCVQSHIESKMSQDTIVRIKAHIDYMISTQNLSSLTVEWFGGEPFLYFYDIVLPLSKYIKQKCLDYKIPFYNGSTTNGSLITNDDVAESLNEINCNTFQITIDGDRNLHNKIKFSNKIDSAFDTTLNNIVSILNANLESKIILRINYTDATFKADIVKDICDIIPKNLRTRIKITLKKVWQVKSDNDRFDSYLSLLDSFKNQGFNITRLDIVSNFIPCYVNKEYYECINYDGHVIKCTNCDDLYSDISRGEFASKGGIFWKENFDKQNMIPTFENSRCLNCIYLPICMGHCPKIGLEGDTSICKLKSMDLDIPKAIMAYIDDQCP